MNLELALQTFITESRELLLSMEDALLQLEQDPQDADAIGATFRAIHTIKGSAGLFGLDEIVHFAHGVETVLDRARAGEIVVDGALSALMLECRDHIDELVSEAAGEASGDDGAARAVRAERLGERLQRYSHSGEAAPKALPAVAAGGEPRNAPDDGVSTVASECWHVSLRPGPETLQNGMDPAPILRYLGSFGELVHVTTLCDGLPAGDDMDPERCYLGFEVEFRSNADRQTIEGAFEFVRDDCLLHIVPPRAPIDAYRALLDDLPEGQARIGEILVAGGALGADELELALAARPALPDIIDAKPQAGEARKPSKIRRGGERHSVRVDADKLGELIDQVGELVIASASAALMARRADDGALSEAMSLMGRLVEEIRDRTLSLRMVEIGETFHRFHRVVRDVSRELGKDIELVVRGEETELDKTVVEKINDPLLHLVRNAMDHGIEATELRLARGKAARGRLSLNAYHESGSIVIEVSDDGGGLNRERILAKAQERGLVAAGQNVSEAEIFKLIFEPGFSTAAQVSNLSGRGVGMDVVKRNIEALRGSIELESREEAGTTIRIRLPLTLAIIDGFLVEVGTSSFVVPLDMVQECLELARDEARAPRTYLDLRGEVLPLVRLRELLSVSAPPTVRENVVVVHSGGCKAGLVVDRLLGEFQTVIKPLGQLFRHLKGISGSTILGSGDVALILDVQSLVQQAAQRETVTVRAAERMPLREPA